MCKKYICCLFSVCRSGGGASAWNFHFLFHATAEILKIPKIKECVVLKENIVVEPSERNEVARLVRIAQIFQGYSPCFVLGEEKKACQGKG